MKNSWILIAAFPFLLGFQASYGNSSPASNSALRTKEFVIMGYEGIISNLRSGDGPYLRTLMELLNVDADRRSNVIDEVKTLSKTYPNIMDFAEQVISFQSERSAKAPEPELPSGPTIYSGDRLENALGHLSRGMKITVFTKGGAKFSGRFDEYTARRMWISGASRRSFQLNDILAVDAPQL